MAKRKKEKKSTEPQSVLYFFYTRERWENWLKTLEEMNFEEPAGDDEMPEGLQSLNNFTEDVNVEVLKIVRLFQNGSFSKESALDRLNEVEEIVMGPVSSPNLADIIQAVQMRFLVLFYGCKKFVSGDASGEIKTLVAEGRKCSESDTEKSLEIAATIGALVIGGDSCCGKYLKGDLEDPSIFDDWLIEIDDIGSALKTLKNFEEEFGANA